MKKKMLVCMVTPLLLLLLVSCSNNNLHITNRETTEPDLSYMLDLSEYSAKGYFGNENAIWVEKSDYTGTQYGCIDREGKFVVPLTDTIIHVYNFSFNNGLSIVKVKTEPEMYGDFAAIYNDNGELVAKFEIYAISSWTYLNNGNIFFKDIDMYGGNYSHSSNAYMYCINTSKFVEMPIPSGKAIPMGSLEYSDGLLLIYSNFYKNPGTKYYDEDGELILDVDNSNQYYKEVMYATNFINGKASIVFIGMDKEWYRVTIDKSGKWIDEPSKTSRNEVDFFC